MVLKRLAESAMKPYSIRSYWRMLTLWFRLGLYRFSRSHEADKGKNKGKKTGQNRLLFCLISKEGIDWNPDGKSLSGFFLFLGHFFKKESVNSIVLSVQICYTKSYRLNK